MAFGVVESTRHNLTEVMAMNVAEVLTMATYLIDKIEVIKLRNGGTNPSPSKS